MTPVQLPLFRYRVENDALKRLAFAVIQTAMADASAYNNNAKMKAFASVEKHKAEARAWLLSPFVWIWFETAGMGVVEHADLLNWIEHNCPVVVSLRECEAKGAEC
jgi:hypothetical protein